ncbi:MULTISPECIES: MotA/TolQ/ExbB proton channel family protein [Halomonas]|uniref:MotA/TolQ/ExbB proton channel family protein n=1 Tax=Halomonas flagellata TaxID=2920385 RepID=A0ABS9RPA3_9GAMM|nr:MULTISPECIES: MotA/TolQ/ExbB proton channel family protein [Halomonas]MCH4561738.1 MotA/TolQ/ExbB proton channel family protein [Halomonas flagellata]PXX99474.1 flagellar motor protein MotA [Halomonas sp. LBP4]
MSMRRLAGGLLLGVTLCLAPLALAQSEALTTLRAEREAAEARDQARLVALIEDRGALEAALDEAREARDAARQRHRELEARQAEQEAWRAELDSRQQEQGSDLEGVLAALARHSGGLRDDLAESWVTVGGAELPPRLDNVEVLERDHLEGVADALMALTAETGRVVSFEALVADGSGDIATREVVRVGDLAAFSDGELLRRGADEGVLSTMARTPREVSQALAAFQAGESRTLALDPTRGGQVIAALAQRPSLVERFHQGGVVGYVVVGLGLLGLLVALAQYGYLLRVSWVMRRQLRDLTQLREDNPLGRVLRRFQTLDDPVPEALEARLDESVLAELPRLERGQSLVKLLAALAPLLGLLGTVTGMIVTFQAITVFGTGDPQLMAGGISQALVTTVLGLITAVPLLFAYTALVGRSRQLACTLEGQACEALAERLERRAPHIGTQKGSGGHATALA